jgi:adenylate cyclase
MAASADSTGAGAAPMSADRENARAVAVDFEKEGLLKGTRGKAREARRRLLEELVDDGVGVEELRRAVAEERLALLPVERYLEGGGGHYTVAEIGERAGVDGELLIQLRGALGLPLDPEVADGTDEDLEAARRMKRFLDAGIPPEAIIENSRVLGMAMAQVAASATALVREAMLRPGDTELEAAHRYLDAARTLQPMLGPALVWAVNLHLREQIRQAVLSTAQLAEGRVAGAQEVTACFADLVDFTRLGQSLDFEALAALTGRLGELARDAARPPIRLVKMIGDAAMLVSPDNDALLEAALVLVEAAAQEGEGFPALRAGLARGEAVARGGDWYGHPINVASRVTDIAYPSSVLCAQSVHDAAGAGYRWSFAGEHRLKGVDGAVKLFRARRDETETA